MADRGFACGIAKEGTRADADASENENGRGTTCWLPKTHRRAQGVTHCQRGALQHATVRCKLIYSLSRPQICMLFLVGYIFGILFTNTKGPQKFTNMYSYETSITNGY